MTLPAETFPGQLSPAESHRFRVYYDSRGLWGTMLVLLLSGFAVLRLLTGAADAPHVDTATSSEVEQAPPAIQPPTEGVYRLRPQTSASLPPVDRLDSDELLQDADAGWNHLPAASWQSLPAEGEAREVDSNSDMAIEPMLLR